MFHKLSEVYNKFIKINLINLLEYFNIIIILLQTFHVNQKLIFSKICN